MGSPLFQHLTALGERIAAAPSLMLFLDFDGTLTPLVDKPEHACLAPDMRRLLQRLSERENVKVAILSGRTRADLLERVGIPGVYYAGNHGLEISGPGCLFVEESAAARQEALRAIVEELTVSLHSIAGVLVEDKGLTVSVHYRLADAAREEEIRRIVDTARQKAGEDFELRTGHKVFEIRPRAAWHKGAAVRWIREQLGQQAALAICLGDDVTDEDAFTTLTGGITVKVGDAAHTAAEFHVDGPAQVKEFLQWLDEQWTRPREA
jgi:trehalose 6-phosphate phosphatase